MTPGECNLTFLPVNTRIMFLQPFVPYKDIGLVFPRFNIASVIFFWCDLWLSITDQMEVKFEISSSSEASLSVMQVVTWDTQACGWDLDLALTSKSRVDVTNVSAFLIHKAAFSSVISCTSCQAKTHKLAAAVTERMPSAWVLKREHKSPRSLSFHS